MTLHNLKPKVRLLPSKVILLTVSNQLHCFALLLLYPPSLLSTLAPPLTLENIQTAVQGVAWRKLGKGLIPHGDYNHESHQFDYPKLDEIAQQHQSDDSRLRAVIECWLQGERREKEPSWRRIIWALDWETGTTARQQCSAGTQEQHSHAHLW